MHREHAADGRFYLTLDLLQLRGACAGGREAFIDAVHQFAGRAPKEDQKVAMTMALFDLIEEKYEGASHWIARRMWLRGLIPLGAYNNFRFIESEAEYDYWAENITALEARERVVNALFDLLTNRREFADL